MNRFTVQLLAIAMILPGCKGEGAQSNDSPKDGARSDAAAAGPGGAQAEGADGDSTPSPSEPPNDPPREPPKDPPRADSLSAIGAKSASHLGFSLDKLAGWYAVDGQPVVPSWAAASDADPETVRDDDLRTAWTCSASGDAKCAMGLSFATPATLRAVRLYGAAGPEYNTYQAHPRVKKVRIHTDAGWVEASVEEGATHGYIVFDAPVETSTIAVEVVQTQGGKSGTIHLAELEAIGTAGPRRPPLDLDPDASAVVFETEAWKQKGEGHTIRLAFLEVVRPDGGLQRLLRGTSLLGRKGDRFLLVEKLHGSRCSAFDGSYILLDQHTRMLYPLGTMGGVPGHVLRKDDGQGFAVRPPTADAGPFRAVVLEEGAAKIKYSPKQDDRAAKAQVDWGFASTPALRRGAGHRLDEPPGGCKSAPTDDAADLFEGFSAQKVVRCDLDGAHTAVFATEDACGRQWRVAVVDDAGQVAHRLEPKKTEGRGLRIARLAGAGLILEDSREQGASADLFRVSGEGIELLAKGATLALRLPASCDPCDDRFAVEHGELGGTLAVRADEADEVPTDSDPDAADADGLPSVDDEDAEG
jgi:hypothetical protein